MKTQQSYPQVCPVVIHRFCGKNMQAMQKELTESLALINSRIFRERWLPATKLQNYFELFPYNMADLSCRNPELALSSY